MALIFPVPCLHHLSKLYYFLMNWSLSIFQATAGAQRAIVSSKRTTCGALLRRHGSSRLDIQVDGEASYFECCWQGTQQGPGVGIWAALNICQDFAITWGAQRQSSKGLGWLQNVLSSSATHHTRTIPASMSLHGDFKLCLPRVSHWGIQ